MSKSNKYGYSGVDIPTQAFKANVGKFEPSEINELVADEQWTQYGQLDLLLTQTVSSNVSTVDFTGLETYGDYNVFLLTLNDITIEHDNKLIGMEFLSNGVASSTNYQVAGMSCGSTGTFNQVRGTSYPALRLTDNIGNGTNECANGYVYIYNNLDSSKYSFITYNGLFQTNSNVPGSEFGSGLLPTTRFDNGLRLHPDQNGSSNFTGGNFSLYGIKEYS